MSTVSFSLVTAVLLAAAAVAQTPQTAPPTAPQAGGPLTQMHREQNFPAPTNLQVLPKDLTGAQVRDIMRHWAGDLGQECDTCHAPYADHRVGRNGRPQLDFASDDKAEKRMARIMYQMTVLDKKDYVAKVAAMDTMDTPAAPLTCGTCHRGNLDPQEYVPPKREEHRPEGASAPPPGN